MFAKLHVKFKRAFYKAAVCASLMGLSFSSMAVDHFWTGATDGDMTKPANWQQGTFGDPGTWIVSPTIPAAGDNVQIGVNPSFETVTITNMPELNVEWPGGSVRALVVHGPDITVTFTGDANYTSNNNANAVRNGSTVHVDSRTAADGPAFSARTNFRIGENGGMSNNVTRLLIDGDGYVQLIRSGTGNILIGTSNPSTQGTPGLIEIRDNGLLEVLGGAGVIWGDPNDPNHNAIVMSDAAELHFYNDANFDAPTSITAWINAGLIYSDTPGADLEVTGTDPTIITVTGGVVQPPVVVAGELLVDVSATDASAGTATWINNGTLGNFNFVTTPTLPAGSNVVAVGDLGINLTLTDFQGVPMVNVLSGTNNLAAYVGPNSIATIEGGDDRSIEAWVVQPETPGSADVIISWAYRGGPSGSNMSFCYGTRTTFGAAIHWGDEFDTAWTNTLDQGGLPDNLPTTGTLHHLVYTYSNSTDKLYDNGVLVVTRPTGQFPIGTGTQAPLVTKSNFPINLFCQTNNDTGALSNNSLPSNLLVNSIRVHSGALTDAQVLANFQRGPDGGGGGSGPVNSARDWMLFE